MENRKKFEFKAQVGNDNGNYGHDIIINGNYINQPNVNSKIRRLPLLDEMSIKYVVDNIEDNLIVTIDSPSISNPGIYYCGNYALNSGNTVKNIEIGIDNQKSDNDLVVINTLAQIAAQAAKEAYLKDPSLVENIVVSVDMTTALPIKQYSKSEAKFFADKFMFTYVKAEDVETKQKAKHKVTVHLGTLRANVEIVFDYVKVIPEGVTAIHAYSSYKMIKKAEETLTKEEKAHNDEVTAMFKEFNEKYFKDTPIDGDYFKNKKILHVAIGEGTTENPLTDGDKFNPNFIHGTNNGIGHAIEKSLPEFKETVNLASFSRQEYSNVIRDKDHKFHAIAEEILMDYLDEQAEEILYSVKNEIQRAKGDVDIVMVYGGGSISMKNVLEKKLLAACERLQIKLFYVPEAFAVKLEVVGMDNFTKGPIFKTLKEKHLKSNN